MTVFVDEAEQVNSQYSQTIQEYGREMVLENLEIQERELKSELMRTYLLNAAGPHIVRSILSHNDSPVGQRIYQEIREEAKRYE